jgi:hypothetical protein
MSYFHSTGIGPWIIDPGAEELRRDGLIMI